MLSFGFFLETKRLLPVCCCCCCCLCLLIVGIHECCFRLGSYPYAYVAFGIVPTAMADETEKYAANVGYAYSKDGWFLAKGHETYGFGNRFESRSTITVRVDLDECTISFEKNSRATGSAKKIDGGRAYNFCFEAFGKGTSATIVEMR